MGELLEKLNKESEAIEIYKKRQQRQPGQAAAPRKTSSRRTVLRTTTAFRRPSYYNYERYEKAAQIYEKRDLQESSLHLGKSGNSGRPPVLGKWFITSFDTTVGYQSLGAARTGAARSNLFQLNELEKRTTC
jgi:hypothetical protein